MHLNLDLKIVPADVTPEDEAALDFEAPNVPEGFIIFGLNTHACFETNTVKKRTTHQWALSARLVARLDDGDRAWDITCNAPHLEPLTIAEANEKWRASIMNWLLKELQSGEFPFEQ